MDGAKNIKRIHNISLKERSSLTVTGVSEIISFDEVSVILDINDSQLNIEGTGLKIASFSADAGDVIIEGMIDTIMYVGKTAASYRKGIIKRIFSYE